MARVRWQGRPGTASPEYPAPALSTLRLSPLASVQSRAAWTALLRSTRSSRRDPGSAPWSMAGQGRSLRSYSGGASGHRSVVGPVRVDGGDRASIVGLTPGGTPVSAELEKRRGVPREPIIEKSDPYPLTPPYLHHTCNTGYQEKS